MTWHEELTTLLNSAGDNRRHEAGSWLPWRADTPVIRHIRAGNVGIQAETDSGWQDIGNYGPGEWLGIRSALYPDLPPRLRWQAVTPVECIEYRWADVERRMHEHPDLRMALEQMARERLYGVIVATHPLFSCLDRDARKQLFKRAMVRMLAPGEKLSGEQGMPANLYLVVSGRLRIEKNGHPPCHRGHGETLGEMAVFGFSEHPAATTTAEDMVEIIEFRGHDVMAAAHGNTAFQHKLADICRSRLLEIMRKNRE